MHAFFYDHHPFPIMSFSLKHVALLRVLNNYPCVYFNPHWKILALNDACSAKQFHYGNQIAIFLKDVRKYVGVSYEHGFKEIKTNPHDHCDQCAYSAKANIATALYQTGRKSAMLKELKQTQQEETL